MLVVEVISPGQEGRDYDDKRRDYWDAGVGEYWIADPVRKTLTVLTRNRVDWASKSSTSATRTGPRFCPATKFPCKGCLKADGF